MVLSIVVFAIPAVVVRFFSAEARYRYIQRWSALLMWWLKVTCRIRYVVEGEENIPNEPVVFMCKHQSSWETFSAFEFLPIHAAVVKQELLRIPVFSVGIKLVDPIAVDRDDGVNALKQVMREGKERLASGRSVLIFPEGTRTAPGVRVKYAKSGASLAKKAGVPVVPVAHNAGLFWGRRAFVKLPGQIRVSIGPPIQTDELNAASITQQVEHWIEGQVEGVNPPSDLQG